MRAGTCRRFTARTVLVLSSALLLGASSLDEREIQFNIPGQPIDGALIAYAQQAHVQLVVSASILKGLRASSVIGSYDAQKALSILLGQSGLLFEVIGPNTITIRLKTDKN